MRLTRIRWQKKIALLFAGQGAQSVGMGQDLAAHHPAAGDLFRQADEILGRSLSEIAWNGPLEELTKTSNCQPALYVHGLACSGGVARSRRRFSGRSGGRIVVRRMDCARRGRDIRFCHGVEAGRETRAA